MQQSKETESTEEPTMAETPASENSPSTPTSPSFSRNKYRLSYGGTPRRQRRNTVHLDVPFDGNLDSIPDHPSRRSSRTVRSDAGDINSMTPDSSTQTSKI